MPATRAGRYLLYGLLGTGGMATVRLGKLAGPGGFARVVAVKRLHAHLATDPKLAARFLDEARLPSSVRHANVVQTLDVVVERDDCLIVMEYVAGESLSRLLQVACKKEDSLPAAIVSAVMSGVLCGLHAAHQATDPSGNRLGIVHRDVSPQNVLVGCDGVARILDFGIAKAVGQTTVTSGGEVRGKIAYMAPEQIEGRSVTARTDTFAAGIVLWESLVGRRLFLDATDVGTVGNVRSMPIEPPSAFVAALPPALDAVVLRALDRDPERRFATAREMALALEKAVPPASAAEVGAWVDALAHEALVSRAAMVEEVEASVDTGTWTVAREVAAPEATTEPGRAARSTRARSVALLALAVVASVGVTVALVRRGTPSGSEGTAAAPPSPDEPLTNDPSPTAAVPLPVGPTSTTARPPSAPRTSPPPRSASASSRCSPAYAYDSSGHRVYKPECF